MNAPSLFLAVCWLKSTVPLGPLADDPSRLACTVLRGAERSVARRPDNFILTPVICDAGNTDVSSNDPSDTTVGRDPFSISKIMLNEYLPPFAVKYCAKIELSRAAWLRRISRSSTVRPQHRVRASPNSVILALEIDSVGA